LRVSHIEFQSATSTNCFLFAEATEGVVFEFCRLDSKQWLESVLGDAPVSAYLEEVVNEYRYKLSANASKLFKASFC
jgi:hypothetical protein